MGRALLVLRRMEVYQEFQLRLAKSDELRNLDRLPGRAQCAAILQVQLDATRQE